MRSYIILSTTLIVIFFNIKNIGGSNRATEAVSYHIVRPFQVDQDRNDSVIKLLADSINSLSGKESIPASFMDECLDLNRDLFWQSIIKTSFRKQIIDRITNVNAIDLLLDNFKGQLQKKCGQAARMKKMKGHVHVPYSEYSTYDLLIEQRLALLNVVSRK